MSDARCFTELGELQGAVGQASVSYFVVPSAQRVQDISDLCDKQRPGNQNRVETRSLCPTTRLLIGGLSSSRLMEASTATYSGM